MVPEAEERIAALEDEAVARASAALEEAGARQLAVLAAKDGELYQLQQEVLTAQGALAAAKAGALREAESARQAEQDAAHRAKLDADRCCGCFCQMCACQPFSSCFGIFLAPFLCRFDLCCSRDRALGYQCTDKIRECQGHPLQIRH